VVVDEQRGIVAARQQPGFLRLFGRIEDARREAVEEVRGGCGDYFDGRDWITTEQKVPTLTLKSNRTLDGQLSGLLSPLKPLGSWIRRKIG
jgi:hypothetical protein